MQSPQQPQQKPDALERNVRIAFFVMWAFWLLTMLAFFVIHLTGKPVVSGTTIGSFILTAAFSGCPLAMFHGLSFCLLMIRRWYQGRQ